MTFKKIALRNFAILFAFTIGLIACEDEFATIDSDIINDDTATNFDTTSETYDVISYTNVLGPVETNNLGVNLLGFYEDPNFGSTVASVVTQVSSSLISPTFGLEGSNDNIQLESVELSIPFFSRRISFTEDGTEYELDSVLPRGDSYEPIKLSLFENNYFLRDFDPNGDFDATQEFFSNKSASVNEPISQADLEAVPIAVIDRLEINSDEIVITEINDDGEEVVSQRLSPRIRKVWNRGDAGTENLFTYWTGKILDQEGEPTLSNSNNFNDYFRGIYFKAEPVDNDGSMMILNLAQEDANITLTYSFTSEEGEQEENTYILSFGPTRVNFFENSYNMLFPSQDGDDVNGDENLILKGGEGAIATIKLFNGENADDDPAINVFEAWRNDFVSIDEATGEFVSAKRLINEANLIFYVNQDLLNQIAGEENQEPDRLYLYDKTNGTPLVDYLQDSQNNSLPLFSIPNHLGILEREETTDGSRGKGIRYKMRITSHINNLLFNNAENVELGIAVSGNVNLEGSVAQYNTQTNSSEEETVPISSIITPRSTVLFGNNVSNSNIDKKLVLEIFYTEPDNN